MKYNGLIRVFGGFVLETGKRKLGLGMRYNFYRVLIGERKAIILML